MTEEFLTESRARSLRRVLMTQVALAVVVALLAIPLIAGDFVGYGVFVLVAAAVFAGVSLLTLQAVRDELPSARRRCLMAGALFIVLSLPLITILVGLVTVISGLGLLFITLAPERKAA